jgi:hypothetical protein
MGLAGLLWDAGASPRPLLQASDPIALARLPCAEAIPHHLPRHRADLAAVADRSAARAIPQTLLSPCPVLTVEGRLATSLAALHPWPLHDSALAAVAESAGTRAVPQPLLLHQTVLDGESGLHLAIAVLHHLALHGPNLAAVGELSEREAAPHCLLAPASSAAASESLPGSETCHNGHGQTNSNELLHRT